jgi:hypothetical protein
MLRTLDMYRMASSGFAIDTAYILLIHCPENILTSPRVPIQPSSTIASESGHILRVSTALSHGYI